MKKYIFRHDEVKVPEIARQDVWDIFTHSKASSAGLDAWELAEFKLFSWEACGWVAKLYGLIEATGRWPGGCGQAKAAFLPKEGVS